jgi:ADP-heptose:LPS heptosyltransferase
MDKAKYDVFFLADSGIGNAVEILYAIEYCMQNNRKAGVYFNNISRSFLKYAQSCYGADVVVDNLENIATINLVHFFALEDKIDIQFDNYFYVNPNYHSTKYLSETEQYLSIVKGLYPSDYDSKTLLFLKENYSERVRSLNPEEKYVLYPGCSSDLSIKRWPYFRELITKIGDENVIVVGGSDDIEFKNSYYYPKWITAITPGFLTRRIYFFNFLKNLGLLHKHAHYNNIDQEQYSFINVFSWEEIVALCKRAKKFIGNDGGLTHLAAACGASGTVIFGPSSVPKNKTYNDKLVPLSTNFECQPCQFSVNNKDVMSRYSILCPYQLRCLYSVNVENVLKTAQIHES